MFHDVWGSVPWWQVGTVANAVNCVACLAVVGCIAVPLHRRRQLQSNPLAVAAMVVFLLLGSQRALQVLSRLPGVLGRDPYAVAARHSESWWLALIEVLIAVAAVYFFARRTRYAQPMLDALLGHGSAREGRVDAVQEQQPPNGERTAAEAERDFYVPLLKTMFANTHSLVQVKDPEGRYLIINAAFQHTFGLVEEEILGRTAAAISPERAESDRASDIEARDGLCRLEETLPTPDGTHILDTVKFPVVDPEGRLLATVCVSSDVTVLRRTITDLGAARDKALVAAVAKSEFLATMSHEIRTPMNAVIGMTELMLGTELDEQQRELLTTVESSGRALLVIIDDILDYSRIEAGRLRLVPEPFHLRQMLEECLDLVAADAAAKSLDLVLYVDDNSPAAVLGDRHRVRQILTNLLTNAVKFTARGEVLLTVTSALTPDGRVQLTMQVVDTGVGIAADDVEQLFQSFRQLDSSTTRSFGGTGLGLVISRRLARAMDGDVTVQSKLGNGSAFTAVVVVEPSTPETVVAGPELGMPQLSQTNILIVDDNPTNLRVLELQLEDLGASCTAVLTSREALTLVDGRAHYDLILLDVNMPQMDGMTLARELRSRKDTANTPIVFISSARSRPDGAETVSAAVLSSPIKKAELAAALTSAIRTHGGPTAPVSRRPLAVPPTDRLHVLLAEDNLVNQRVAQLMLSKLGHDFDTVADGVEALAAVHARCYDVVLMDVQMPRMDGIEATERIRADVAPDHQPYIIAITADVMNDNRRACLSAGMDGYLNKPVHVRQLHDVLAGARDPGALVTAAAGG